MAGIAKISYLLIHPAPPQIQKFTDFFEPLISKLRDIGFCFQKDRYNCLTTLAVTFLPLRTTGIWYAASLEGKNDAWVTVHIRTDHNEVTKHHVLINWKPIRSLDRNHASQQTPNPDWHWRRHNRHTFSSISIRKDGSIDDPADRLEGTRCWMLDLLPKLKGEFDSRIAKIRSDDCEEC